MQRMEKGVLQERIIAGEPVPFGRGDIRQRRGHEQLHRGFTSFGCGRG
jgi:hypothetical protein